MNKYEKRTAAARKKRERIKLPKSQRVKLEWLAQAAQAHGLSKEFGVGVEQVDGDEADFTEAMLDVELLVKRLNAKIKKLEIQLKDKE